MKNEDKYVDINFQLYTIIKKLFIYKFNKDEINYI